MKILYKCRLCGVIYSDTSCPENTAHFIVENLCVSDEVTIHGMRVKRYDTHICEQGNPNKLGYADFIGAISEEIEKSCKSAGSFADAPTLMPGA